MLSKLNKKQFNDKWVKWHNSFRNGIIFGYIKGLTKVFIVYSIIHPRFIIGSSKGNHFIQFKFKKYSFWILKSLTNKLKYPYLNSRIVRNSEWKLNATLDPWFSTASSASSWESLDSVDSMTQSWSTSITTLPETRSGPFPRIIPPYRLSSSRRRPSSGWGSPSSRDT